ncbi:phage tail assembly protein [Cellulosilyticum sp. I15G10I2]|uniref:phage tail assembly protein n=1 Tax=Cellulosilyticum sp. I15G10I2 TaxID=1892843 RepID=UPI00114D1CDB|nr:phage tail assembly protein [Cellulosilyticum sp. I15G10I2]
MKYQKIVSRTRKSKNKEIKEFMHMENQALKLSKPIMVNGEEVKELKYDFENMTARDKINVGKRIKQDGVPVSVEELDTDYHMYLFAGAVVKANEDMDISDVMRLSAKDIQKGAALARNFFYLNSEE